MIKEGNLEAPTRHALDWQNPDFYNETAVLQEMERVFDLCHGCRRCVSLCQAFPTLFDLIDESATLEIDGVNQQDYWKVVDHCYLCDLCYMTKCPYIPPHEWNLDFPHLMLRAKAVKFQQGQTKFRDKLLTSTDFLGKMISIPIVAQTTNAANRSPTLRKALDTALAVHPAAKLPEYHCKTLRKKFNQLPHSATTPTAIPTEQTRGRVALFTTCYGNYNEPIIGEDLIAVFQHNEIAITLLEKEQCCGMPKLELGDLAAVARAKEANIPILLEQVKQGWDIVAPVPSCVLMFRQELPLMFPNDPAVQQVKAAIFDPFEYLFLRHKAGLFKTDFKKTLGTVAYHVACHQRVQNIGLKTRDILALVPNTQIQTIERCSGHDGTYAVKREFHAAAMKIVQPIVKKLQQNPPDHYGSDCPMAGHHIENAWGSNGRPTEHPMSLLRQAYGI